jgi:hypothetical protein
LDTTSTRNKSKNVGNQSIWRKRKSINHHKGKHMIKLAYCDYIASIIKKELLSNDHARLLDEVGKIQFNFGPEGEFDTTKTIDVLDMQGKMYRITIQEL